MTFQNADGLSLFLFYVFSAAMFLLISVGLLLKGISKRYLGVFIFVVLASSLAAHSGVFREHIVPGIPIFFLSLVAMSTFFVRGEPGRVLSEKLTFTQIIGFQSFRLLLEILLHHWARTGVIPETMTWTGQNWDIISGGLALVVAPVAAKSFRTVWVFQVISFALLLNVIRVVVMSMPFPFAWQLQNPLQLALYFPYVLVGPLFVWPALFGHMLIFRKLKTLKSCLNS